MRDGTITDFTRDYMGYKLLVKIYQGKKDGTYVGHITYRADDWTYEWTLPDDLYAILPELYEHLEEDVAEVVYEAINDYYNNALTDFQLLIGTKDATAIRFPPKNNFTAELEMIRNRLTTPRIISTPTITTGMTPNYGSTRLDATDRGSYIQYVSADEYEEMRANGQLSSGTMYLILN